MIYEMIIIMNVSLWGTSPPVSVAQFGSEEACNRASLSIRYQIPPQLNRDSLFICEPYDVK